MIARLPARHLAGLLLGAMLGVLSQGLHTAMASTMDEDADAPRYAIRQVLVQGAAAFKPDILKSLYAPALTHALTDDEIASLADSVTDYYRRGGYFLASATVPRQRLDYGLLVLRVSEGDIADVRVDGDAALYTKSMKAAIEHLLTVRPMTGPAFTQALKAFAAAISTRTAVELAPSNLGEGHYELRLHLTRGETGIAYVSAAGDGSESRLHATPASAEAGDTSDAIPELAPDLMTRQADSDRYGAGADARRTRPAVGPFYVPGPDGRHDSYALLDHGPGWYKRSEDTAGIPTALGVRLRDDDTKVGLEAGIPYDKRVEPIGTRGKEDPVEVLFTVGRHF